MREFINNRHKIVQLSKKRGDWFLSYCISKGEELNREIQKIYPLGKGNQEHFGYNVLCITYKINGYYAFAKINIEQISNKDITLKWSSEAIEKYVEKNYNIVDQWGLSVNELRKEDLL